MLWSASACEGWQGGWMALVALLQRITLVAAALSSIAIAAANASSNSRQSNSSDRMLRVTVRRCRRFAFE